MLSDIHIRDFALIDKLDLTFSVGFSVLTGETGAGKSIIIDAINATLGERLSTDIIRTGSERALVEAVFDLSDSPDVKARAAELDVEIEDDTLFLSREINRGGKSQCRVNGRLCTLSALKELTGGLLDLHGQHEHQSLLSANSHLEVLDNWCGPDALAMRGRVAELYTSLRDARRQLDELRTNERDRAHLLDLYRFQVTEIESAALQTDEEEQLAVDRTRLANAEKLHTLASTIYEALGGESGALGSLSTAAKQAEQMAALDPSVANMSESLATGVFAAEEAYATIRAYRDDIEFNPQRLETIEDRFDLLRTLKRKYGDSIEAILAYADETAKKVNDLENSEERTADLEQRIDKLQTEAVGVASELSELRSGGAKDFEDRVMRELSEVAMERTEFRVSIQNGELGPKGSDDVEFLISPNPGEPLKPLVKIASGGEMSRIMLALKSVMAVADRVPTLIFDEIDAGIGGRTANIIGDKLAALGKGRQVMCVTHLPQIAGRARAHFTVEKHVTDGRTNVEVRKLEDDARVQELARMLGGDETAATALQHAKEMLRPAGK